MGSVASVTGSAGSSEVRSEWGRTELCLAVAGAAAVVFFAVAGLGRPLWLDEAAAVLVSRDTLPGVFRSLPHNNNLPAYYLILWAWIRVFGESEAAVHALSTVCYLAGGAMVYRLASAVSGRRREALYTTILYLGSVQLIRQAHLARPYTMLGLLSATSLWLFVRIFVEEREGEGRAGWGPVCAFTIVNSIGALTHVWFLFVLFGEGIAVLALRRKLRVFAASVCATALVFGVLWGPVFLGQAGNSSNTWFPRFRPVFVMDELTEFYGIETPGTVLLAVCLAPLAMAARGLRRASAPPPGTRAMLIVLAACLITPQAVTAVKPIYFPARYSTIALPALAVALGAILARLARPNYARAACFGVLAVAAAGHTQTYRMAGDAATPIPLEQSDRATAEYIVRRAAPGDAIVFTGLTRVTADYYFRRWGAEGRFAESSFPEEVDRHLAWQDVGTIEQHPERLGPDAARFVAQLAERTPPGRSVWVYEGIRAIDDALKPRLEAHFKLMERHQIFEPQQHAGRTEATAVAVYR